MKTLELEKPEILSHLEYMTEEEFVDWYDEDVKAEWFWKKELPNVFELVKKLNLV